MKNQSFQNTFIVLLIGLLFTSISFAQQNNLKNYRLRFNLNTIKQSDNSRLLEVKFEATNKKDRKDKVPVYDAEINFFNVLDDLEVNLGKSKTNDKGIAQLTVPENHVYLLDEEGYINLKAVFKKTDAIKSYKKEIAIKDIFLELDLTEIDSIKTVVLNAFTLDSLKTKIPVEDAEFVLSVGGMISKMPIDEGTLEDGEYEFEFPLNIPGNSEGNIDVYVTIDDHDDFGTVVIQKTVNWGAMYEREEIGSNTLWSDAAPIWMYVVLSILLIGVWTNYFYSISNLLKIKKEGKEIESENI